MTVKVVNSVPKLLFRSETFDLGWKATVDDKPALVYRADYDFQAVPVPEGEHTVVFSYWPTSLTYGMYAMLMGIGIMISMIGIHKKKKKPTL